MQLGRKSGILAHISSLPGPYPIGDLGPEARGFAGFLSGAGQSLWQVLPLTPTRLEYGNSPYSSPSAFAGNPLLISPDDLAREGLVSQADLKRARLRYPRPRGRVIYPDAYGSKLSLLDRAFREALPSLSRNRKYLEFCDRHRFWLDDYALYEALHQDQGGGWRTWPPDLRDRGGGLEQERERLEEDVRRQKFYQYLFFRQWLDLRDHCSKQGILLVGDVPVYVSYNSADVWAHRALFNLDEQGDPVTVSGVPPDYFSETGQLWNNPIFRWDRLKRDGYGWWVRRMKHNLLLFDWVRLDHFRGFEAFWEVPAGESTAINGSWTPGPGRDFFETLRKHAPGLPFIAEDLGVITEEVTSLRDAFGMPGMRVLQFGFGDGDYHLPHRYEQNFVAYTGTHDNNTLVGWMRSGELNGADRKRALKYAGAGMFGLRSARWDFIRMLMASRAGWVIIPLQDVLGLGGRCRMNSPSTSEGNWEWRLHPGGLKKPHAVQLGEMSGLYGRNDR